MISAIVSFSYYLGAYSLGIAVLVTVYLETRIRKDRAHWWFLVSTLAMTLTVLVSTLQNFLRLPAESALSGILTGINYLTASFFTVVIVRFFHEAYPWRGARTVNALALLVTGSLTACAFLGSAFALPASSPDMLLIAKNAAILYTAILTIACRHRPSRTRSIRFTRIIVPIVLLGLPFLFVTEFVAFKSFMRRLFPDVSLRGPWILPGIYVLWCLSWFAAGSVGKKPEPMVPPDAFCALCGITPREREVMGLLVQGRSYREIGDSLCISLPTVKTHVSSLYRKTDTLNRLELAVKAGLVAKENE
jgi:DNA-binding CsgD family transcriptional regulator